MSNLITHPKYGQVGALRMSNGRTDVFLSVMVIAGSHLASSNGEQQFVLWIAGRDQSGMGRGVVGFDVSDLPWSENREAFETQKSFVLKLTEAAKNELGWESIKFGTRPDALKGDLEQFRMLALNLEFSDVPCPAAHTNRLTTNEPASRSQSSAKRPIAPKHCPHHGVLMSKYGCIACNSLG